jgi:hypothetical protein
LKYLSNVFNIYNKFILKDCSATNYQRDNFFA